MRVLRPAGFAPRGPWRRRHSTASLKRHKPVSPAPPSGGLCGPQKPRASPLSPHLCPRQPAPFEGHRQGSWAPSAWLASLRRSGSGIPVGTCREPSIPQALVTSFLSSLVPSSCVKGRSSVPCGSGKRRDPRRLVPANTFINHSSMEVSGIAAAWEQLAAGSGEYKGLEDRVSLVSWTRTLKPREQRLAHDPRASDTFPWTLR